MQKENPKTEPKKKDPDVLDILIAPDPKLRKVADPVLQVGYDEFKLIEDMFETMDKSNGMGLAATQVGVNKRIIVMDVVNLAAYEEDVQQDIKTFGRFAIVNPLIIERSDRKVKWNEGCLSVPGFQYEVERSPYVVVEGLDEHGKDIKFKATGLLAACVQHEIDHLDGKLFIDHISRLKKDMTIRKLKKFRRTGRMVVRRPTAPSL